MKSQHEFNTIPSCCPATPRQSARAKLRLLAIAALAATLSLAIVPQSSAAVVHVLKGTYFETNGGVNAACNIPGCLSGPVPLFPPLAIKCAGAVGVTCTFYIHLETDDVLTPNDMGIFQFLVNALPPAPGPTFGGPLGPGGDFIWDNTDPLSAVAFPVSRSYAVTAAVTNTVANQVDVITVNLACNDAGINNAGGCSATTFLANLQVAAYTP